MWLLLHAFRKQWARARSNEYLLQLRMSSDVLINNKWTKGSAMTLPQVRGSTWQRYPRSSLGDCGWWCCSLLLLPTWFGKGNTPNIPFSCLQEPARGERKRSGDWNKGLQVLSRAEPNGRSSHAEVVLLPSPWSAARESCLKGNMSWPLVSRWDSARWILWGHRIQGIHRSHTVRI